MQNYISSQAIKEEKSLWILPMIGCLFAVRKKKESGTWNITLLHHTSRFRRKGKLSFNKAICAWSLWMSNSNMPPKKDSINKESLFLNLNCIFGEDGLYNLVTR